MILKGSQRGGAKQLARHLLKTEENEHVEVHELRGFLSSDLKGALHETYAVSQGTRCKQFMFSLSLNPPDKESVSVEVFEEAIDKIEKKLGLENQPRAIVFHEKEGRRHAHCVWSRIDTEKMKAINLPHYKLKLRDVSRELYLEHGWQMPRGLMNSKERDPLNFSRAEWQQAKRAKQDPRALKALLTDCWAVSDSKRAFAGALEERGYYLARGDRRGFVAVDFRGEVYSLSRWMNVRTKDLKTKLGDPKTLPDIDQAKAFVARRMTSVVKGYINEVEAEFKHQASTLKTRRTAMTLQHRQERETLDQVHEERWDTETNKRAKRLPKGLSGIWGRITGRYGRIRRQNEMETYQAYQRDQIERQALIDRQLEERRELQSEITRAHTHHSIEMTRLHQDVAHYMSLGDKGTPMVREQFREVARPQGKAQRDDRGHDFEPEP